jgi:hypothetical protein
MRTSASRSTLVKVCDVSWLPLVGVEDLALAVAGQRLP